MHNCTSKCIWGIPCSGCVQNVCCGLSRIWRTSALIHVLPCMHFGRAYRMVVTTAVHGTVVIVIGNGRPVLAPQKAQQSPKPGLSACTINTWGACTCGLYHYSWQCPVLDCAIARAQTFACALWQRKRCLASATASQCNQSKGAAQYLSATSGPETPEEFLRGTPCGACIHADRFESQLGQCEVSD